MQYYSLNNKNEIVDFKTATIQGQATDKGLYFPEKLPTVNPDLIKNIANYSNTAIAYEIMQPFVGESLDASTLKNIVEETFNFPIPLVKVNETIFSLELYHGPTLAFKDVGARFMSRCLGHFVKGTDKKVTVLVATSGDTGGAVANGFYNVDGVEVIILYPSGKVSNVQEKQLTTLGNNITALEVNGSFDDCQAMVKAAFLDTELKQDYFLTSANSINVARWLPQQLYYFYAYKQWVDKNNPPVVSVPSGNFGNIAAGIVAHLCGLPVQHFIAACNANDVVPKFMQTQNYTAQKATPTISNAMDVGDPSNFVRILQLFNKDFPALQNRFSAVSVSDATTRETLLDVYKNHNYLCDTHGAVGYKALADYIKKHPSQKGIFLETAHPIKFYDVVEPIINETIPLPEAIQATITKEKKSILIESNFEALKNYLLSK